MLDLCKTSMSHRLIWLIVGRSVVVLPLVAFSLTESAEMLTIEAHPFLDEQ